MEYYEASDRYATEAEAVAAAKEKLAKQKREKAKQGMANELNDWIYVIGPDGNGYRVNS